jgi:hypothetical protein
MAPGIGICGPKSSRRYLILVNFLTALIGIIFLGIGGWSLTQGNHGRSQTPLILRIVWVRLSSKACGLIHVSVVYIYAVHTNFVEKHVIQGESRLPCSCSVVSLHKRGSVDLSIFI